MNRTSDIALDKHAELNFVEYPVGKLERGMVICYGKADTFGLVPVQEDALDDCNHGVIQDVVYSSHTTLIFLLGKRYLLLDNELKYSASLQFANEHKQSRNSRPNHRSRKSVVAKRLS